MDAFIEHFHEKLSQLKSIQSGRRRKSKLRNPDDTGLKKCLNVILQYLVKLEGLTC